MRIERVTPADRSPDRRRPRSRRFRKGERVSARVVRVIGGPLVLLDVEGRRLVAWMEREVSESMELYLEVVSASPALRFRRMTGGAAFWSLPVGTISDDEIDVRA